MKISAGDIYNQCVRDGLPVDNVSGSPENWNITWTRQLNPQEQELAAQVPAQAEAYAQRVAQWEAFLADGWTDSITGIKLATDTSARSKFTSYAAYLRDQLDLGKMTNDTLIQIWDFDGNPHTLTVLQCRNLLADWGTNWLSNYAQYAP